MPGHERADVLAEVDDDDLEAILDALTPETAADTRELMSYPPESAGGLMVRDFLSFPPQAVAREVLETITSGERDLSRYLLQYCYVVGRGGRLLGVVRTRNLVAADPATEIRALSGRAASGSPR